MTQLELHELVAHAEEAVALLKQMAHKDRLAILCHLTSGELSAGDLARRSLLSQSAFSQHLAVLRAEKMVATRKEAQTIYYSLANSEVVAVLTILQQVLVAKNYGK
jgi:DNA-binding transcriptional ArsR family regulator